MNRTAPPRASPSRPRTPAWKATLAGLLAGAFLTQVLFMLRQPVWHPLDELAHYDYLDRLAALELPSASEDITDYTARITFEHFTWLRPSTFRGTKATMGFARKSYEACQPPLYYLALAPANRALKALGVEPPLQIRWLRFGNMLLVLAGALLTIPVFRELQRSFGVDERYGWLLAGAVLVFDSHRWHALGNGHASLLACNASALALLVLHRTGSTRAGLLASLAAALAFLTKVTNGLMLLVLAGALTAIARADRSRWPGRRILLVASPLALVAAYGLANVLRTGSLDWLNTAATGAHFAGVELSTPGALGTWSRLVRSSLASAAFGDLPRPLALPALGLVLANALALAWRSRAAAGPRIGPLHLALALTLGVLASAAMLARLRPDVDWGDFRHFSGYGPAWWTAVLAPAWSGRLLRSRWLPALYGGMLAAAVATQAWRELALRLTAG